MSAQLLDPIGRKGPGDTLEIAVSHFSSPGTAARITTVRIADLTGASHTRRNHADRRRAFARFRQARGHTLDAGGRARQRTRAGPRRSPHSHS